MTTQAKIGHGILFSLANNASPPVYTALAEVTSVTPPSIARDALDATHSESPEKWREFIAGLKDGGEVSIELNFIPGAATTSTIAATFDTDAMQNARITFPDSPPTLWEFSGIITGFAPEGPVDDKMTATVTFKVSGKPNLSA